jgi:hypothetical protein
MSELYSYDLYWGFSIFVESDGGTYYGSVHFNGVRDNTIHNSASSGSECLAGIKDMIDKRLQGNEKTD